MTRTLPRAWRFCRSFIGSSSSAIAFRSWIAIYPAEKLNYDNLFFLSTFNGPWGPYHRGIRDVLYILSTPYGSEHRLSLRRPVGRSSYIRRKSGRVGPSIALIQALPSPTCRSGLALRCEVDNFAKNASELSPEIFAVEFNRLLAVCRTAWYVRPIPGRNGCEFRVRSHGEPNGANTVHRPISHQDGWALGHCARFCVAG